MVDKKLSQLVNIRNVHVAPWWTLVIQVRGAIQIANADRSGRFVNLFNCNFASYVLDPVVTFHYLIYQPLSFSQADDPIRIRSRRALKRGWMTQPLRNLRSGMIIGRPNR